MLIKVAAFSLLLPIDVLVNGRFPVMIAAVT